jgi:beta-lactamase regulating signal transducer with metallopeptidase domain
MELACDAKVLKSFDDGQKKAYALSLLNSTASKTFFASAFGGVKVKVRIENILSYRKLTFLSLAGIIALISVIAFVLLTNAPVN